MPEGHSIRHLATVHEGAFAGKTVRASSPQGRFADQARDIDGRVLNSTTAHGKHLFLHFDTGQTVHVHLGLYGWFHLSKNPNKKPKDTTRLRLQHDIYISDLVAPTACELLDDAGVSKIRNRLGPDPIHDDADPEQAWNKIIKSKRTIAGLLMDQSVIAGIGNVYRAELLFLSRLDPLTPGTQMQREKFDEIWKNASALLRDGSTDGKIRTVAPEHLTSGEVELHGCAQFSYVYKRPGQLCRLCTKNIREKELESRTLYWCPTCQR